MRRRLLLLAGCALAATLLTLLWPRDREPQYQGKSLSQWLSYVVFKGDASQYDQAVDAVHHIGTNCIPWLLKWTRYERPAWRYKLIHATETVVPYKFLEGTLGNLIYGQAEGRVYEARFGFEILGPEARSAIPELIALAKDSKRPFAAENAANALVAIWQGIVPRLDDPDLNVRVAATNLLNEFPREALERWFRMPPR